ncbi:MAG TPA: sulfotransferase, partial [Gemmataceae bacterium]|nr:sulfotransferase [Gemmataceae bacterium]
MHRSGTSLITRLVNLLGVSLGPVEHLMKPLPDNPKGFWENQLLTDMNDEILSRLGGGLYHPPEFYSGWENAATLADLRQRARALLNEDFGVAKLWGWKDPRNCLTLPFWRSLLPNLRYLICIRNPIDVIHSLERRDKFSFDKGASLWFTYMTSALANSAGQPRLFVSYEEIMNDWQGTLPRIAEFIGTPDAVDRPELKKNVKGFIDAELQHHRTSTGDALAEQRLPVAAKSLYFVLKQFTNLDRSSRRCPDDRQNLELDLFSRRVVQAQAETDSLRTTLDGLRTALDGMRTTVDMQKKRLAAKEQLAARLQNELKVNKSNQKLLESALERERQAREL